jgi:flagellar protein FliL
VAKSKEVKAEVAGSVKPSILSTLIPVLLITIIAIGGGFGMGALSRGNSPAIASASGTKGETGAANPEGDVAAENAVQAEVTNNKLIVRTLAPIISNLGTPSDTWMRLELSLLLDEKAKQDEDVIAVKSSDYVVSFLRTLSLKKLEGPSGFLHFREDLNDLLSDSSDKKIVGVLIGSMVVE